MQRTQFVTMGPATIIERFILTSDDLTEAAGAQTIELLTLPKGSIVKGVRVKTAEAFTGGGSSSATVEVGSKGVPDTDLFSPAFDIFQAVDDKTAQMVSGWKAGTYASDTLTATFKADVNVALLTTGRVYIDVEVWLMPNLVNTGPLGNSLATGGYI